MLFLIFILIQFPLPLNDYPKSEMLTTSFNRTKAMNISEGIETETLVHIAIGHVIDARKIHIVQAGGNEM